MSNGALKTIATSLGEGEADTGLILSLVANHVETKVIKGGAHVVDRVTNDQSKRLWNGMLGLDVNKSPRWIFALRNSQLERSCREKLLNLPLQVQDVVLGPI